MRLLRVLKKEGLNLSDIFITSKSDRIGKGSGCGGIKSDGVD